MRLPPAVRHGLVSEQNWAYLMEAGRRDEAAFIKYARELCRDNVPLWNHIFLKMDVASHMVEARRQAGDFQRILIEIARDHSKSWDFTIGTTTHRLCYSTLPNSPWKDPRILVVQESGPVAKKVMFAIQNPLRQNKLIKAAFGNIDKQADKWTEEFLWLPGDAISKDPSLAVVGYTGAVTGGHPKLFIGDDMVSRENSKTPHLRTQMRITWQQTFAGMLGNAQQYILFTPYYEDDLHGYLKTTKSYRHIRLPALGQMPEADDYEEVWHQAEGQDLRVSVKLTEKGLSRLTPLWPCPLGEADCPYREDDVKGWNEHLADVGQHRPLKMLILEMLRNPVGFREQWMLDLRAGDEALIKPEMLRFWAPKGSPLVGKTTIWNESPIVQFPDPAQVIAAAHGWDHAISQTRKADRTALCKWYRTEDNRYFRKDLAGKWAPDEVVVMMGSQYATDPVRRPGMVVSEGISFQEMFKSQVSNADSSVPVVTLKDIGVRTSGVDKATQLVESGLLAAIMNGQVYFEATNEDVINEHLNFTGLGHMKDDTVDAGRIGFYGVRATTKRKVRVTKRRVDGPIW